MRHPQFTRFKLRAFLRDPRVAWHYWRARMRESKP